MCSYKYHCLFKSNPGIVVSDGEEEVKSMTLLETLMGTSSLSEYCRTKIVSGLPVLDFTRKLWYDRMLGTEF